MPLNKLKKGSDMYQFITATWNPIRGKCSHDCEYCYMKRFPQKDLRLDEKELKTDLGEGNFIFVGSSTDMFADDVNEEWIKRTMEHCCKYTNTYLFQTKNPKRIFDVLNYCPDPKLTIFGITLETNRDDNIKSHAPRFLDRVFPFKDLLCNKMITIEPIMDFDVEIMVKWIKLIKPEFVNIGADSGGHKLPEPSPEKIKELIKELEKFTKVNLKDNLKRLYSP